MVSIEKHLYRALVSGLVFLLAVGTVFYHVVEKFSWVDAYFFSVITMSTVGYGDLVPHTTAGKLFTTFYIVAGIGVFSTFISFSLRRRADKVKNNQDKNS